MQIDLTGKTALVCGSSQGIGKAIALQLAQAGARIILLARNPSSLETVLAELNTIQAQNEHTFFVADFSDNQRVEEVAEEIASSYEIDILINNTGGPAAGPAHTAALTDYLRAFENHLINNQILTQAFLPSMKNKGYGRIINIISTSVKQPLPNLGVSNTIRGAVANWSKTLANELGAFGITVNNILPGATETSRLQNIIQNKAGKTGHSTEAVSTEMLAEIPAKRFARAEEIAYAACFLSSPLASYINGINLPVDGGRTACL
jgi:3-oxoacyl-[acyl-carrier protein] reductase